MVKEIHIVGMGPVGLFAAYSLLRIDQGRKQIFLYEKRSKTNFMKRGQVLFFQKDMWNMLDNVYPFVARELKKNVCRQSFAPPEQDVGQCLEPSDDPNLSYYSMPINLIQTKMIYLIKRLAAQYNAFVSFNFDRDITNADLDRWTSPPAAGPLLAQNYVRPINLIILTIGTGLGKVDRYFPDTRRKEHFRNSRLRHAIIGYIGNTDYNNIYTINRYIHSDGTKAPRTNADKLRRSNIPVGRFYTNPYRKWRPVESPTQSDFRGFLSNKMGIYVAALFTPGDPGRPKRALRRAYDKYINSSQIGNTPAPGQDPIFNDGRPMFPTFTEFWTMINDSSNNHTGISEFPVSVTQVDGDLYKRINGHHLFVAGDAAYSHHFFTGRGVNDGMQSVIDILRIMSINQSSPSINNLDRLSVDAIRSSYNTAVHTRRRQRQATYYLYTEARPHSMNSKRKRRKKCRKKSKKSKKSRKRRKKSRKRKKRKKSKKRKTRKRRR